MIEIVKKADYKELLTLLIQKYQDREKFKGLLKPSLNQANDLETALFEIRDEYKIDNAIGVQLDILGEIIGIEREGREDDSYRTILKVKASINNGGGTPEKLILTATELYDSENVQYTPVYPASVELWSDGNVGLFLEFDLITEAGEDVELEQGDITLLGAEPDDIAEDLLEEVLPSGVSLQIMDDLITETGELVSLENGIDEIIIAT